MSAPNLKIKLNISDEFVFFPIIQSNAFNINMIMVVERNDICFNTGVINLLGKYFLCLHFASPLNHISKKGSAVFSSHNIIKQTGEQLNRYIK